MADQTIQTVRDKITRARRAREHQEKLIRDQYHKPRTQWKAEYRTRF